MRNCFRILVTVSLLTAGVGAQNPTPTTIPNGLPEWAYNIPDKVQPPEPRVPATVRAPGSGKEYEASAIAGNANPPDWFPDEHPRRAAQREGSDAERVRLVPPDVGTGASGIRRHRGHAGRIHHSADELLQERRAEGGGAHGADRSRGLRRRRAARRRSTSPAIKPNAIREGDRDRDAAEDLRQRRRPASAHSCRTAAPSRSAAASSRSRTIRCRRRSAILIPASPRTCRPAASRSGKALAKTGDSGKTIQCAICHGDALTGLGEVPRIAGLQPVYIARQLITMQNGTSAGTNAALMKKVVAKLSEDDIIALSAYLGSLPPR